MKIATAWPTGWRTTSGRGSSGPRSALVLPWRPIPAIVAWTIIARRRWTIAVAIAVLRRPVAHRWTSAGPTIHGPVGRPVTAAIPVHGWPIPIHGRTIPIHRRPRPIVLHRRTPTVVRRITVIARLPGAILRRTLPHGRSFVPHRRTFMAHGGAFSPRRRSLMTRRRPFMPRRSVVRALRWRLVARWRRLMSARGRRLYSSCGRRRCTAGLRLWLGCRFRSFFVCILPGSFAAVIGISPYQALLVHAEPPSTVDTILLSSLLKFLYSLLDFRRIDSARSQF